jgi:hypothetical protein
VFGVNLQGREVMLYGFSGSPDGSGPQGAVIKNNGMILGTTQHGGTYCAPYGCGAAYTIKI